MVMTRRTVALWGSVGVDIAYMINIAVNEQRTLRRHVLIKTSLSLESLGINSGLSMMWLEASETSAAAAAVITAMLNCHCLSYSERFQIYHSTMAVYNCGY